MFENFTFDTLRSSSIDSNNTSSTQESRSVSPCSETSPYTAAAQYSVTDLAALLQRQQLHQQSQIYSRPCDSYANLDDDAGWSVDSIEVQPTRRPRSGSPSSFSLCRRRDRQINARLLCSATHHRDIRALVANMISQHEQCFVSPPTSMPVQSLQVDSEDSEDDEDMEPLSRQSSTLSVTRTRDFRRHTDSRRPGTSICKEIRLRKDKPRRQKSGDK